MTFDVNWDASSQGAIGMPADRPGNFRNLKLAPWWARVAAGIVDYGIVGFIPGAIGVGICTALGVSTQPAIWFAYLLIAINSGFLASYTTQSLGKRLLGIRMVQSVLDPHDPSGAYLRHVPLGTALLRLVLHIFDTFPLPIGWFWPVVDRNNATFADKMTRVLNTRDDRADPERGLRGKREWHR